MENKEKSQQIQEELKNRNSLNVETGNEVVFDPVTGELVVVETNKNTIPDGTVVSQIAEDGFATNLQLSFCIKNITKK